MTRRRAIVIAGPTASGKTALALQIATELNTSIISADSRQCYHELNIGVARPSPDQLRAVNHFFIASHSIHQTVTAATFETYALQRADEIFADRPALVMAGGTGLYIKAFTDGLDDIPAVDDSIRNQLRDDYAQKGIAWLQEETARIDPIYFRDGEIQNPRRLLRALEVKLSSGYSIREFQSRKPATRNFEVKKFAIDIPREELYRNIATRTEQMMADGLLEEARALYPYRSLSALHTVGYRELFDYFSGIHSLDEAVSKIISNTRQYARRQLTWLRKDREIIWVRDASAISAELESNG